MLCQSNPSNLSNVVRDESNPYSFTVEELMNNLYPRVFSTFVKSNPAIDTYVCFFIEYFLISLTEHF